MSPTLAVVVCSRDRSEALRRCLEAIDEQPVDDVLVVDSASASPDTREAAAAAGRRCIRVEQPGLSRARNAALRATTADVVAFTDDDCVPQPGWADALRRVAGVESTAFVLGQVTPVGEGPPVSVLVDPQPRRYTAGDDASHLGHGANLAVTRPAWEALGGFDELLGVGASLRSGEDTDFLWRALRSGWTGHYQPEAVVTHQQWRGRSAALATSFGYGVGAGAVHTKVRRLAGAEAARRFSAGSIGATLGQAASDARAGYAFGAVSGVVRSAGIATGRWRAGRLSLDDGHLVPRR